MPDIESVIYKLELDSSGYIRGVDAAASSLTRLNEVQTDAKKRLDTNEAALKANADRVTQANKALESYTGTNDRYRKQLEKDIKSAQADQAKLIDLVKKTADEYDQATKAAQGFAGVSQKATQVQAGTTGGKIPVAPPVVQPPIVQEIQARVDTTGLDELPAILAQSNDEFEQLRTAIALTEEAMKGLNAEDEDFKSLASIVASGKDVLAQFDQAAGTASDSAGDLKKEVKQGGDEIRKFATSTDQAGDAVLSLKGQIRAGKEELVKLEAAGKSASKEYQQLELRVAELTDAFGDQQNRIKVLASDTRALDFGKAAITSALGAFQAYTSAAILLGAENEDLTKKTQQLFAAMQLLTSLEQLMAQVQRGGVLITNAQAAAQAAYTAVVGASTGALRVFRLALAATGIGVAIAAITFLVIKWKQFSSALSEAGEKQKLFKEINDKAIDSYAGEVVKLEQIRVKLTDLNIPQKDRIELAKEYNKTADEGNKIDLKQIDNIQLLNAAIDTQIQKIKERAIATAANNVLTEKATDFFKQQASIVQKFPALNIDDSLIDKSIEDLKKGIIDKSKFTPQQVEQLAAAFLSGDLSAFLKARREFDRVSKQVASFTPVGGLTGQPTPTPPPKTTKSREIENEFQKRKLELDQRLAELLRQENESVESIKNAFLLKLKQAQDEIDKARSEGKLTKPQANILKVEAAQINTAELEKALADFRKKITDARQKLNDELQDLQSKALQDSINLIQDDFDRRAKLIEFNEQKELDDARKANEKRLAALDLDRALIGEEEFQKAKAIIITNGEQQAINILQKFAIERQDLAADSFKKILDAYQSAISFGDLVRDEGVAKLIRNVSDRFLSGKISFERYQREITKIQRENEAIRRDATLASQRGELLALDKQIAKIKDKDSKQYKDLLKTREDLRAKIAAGEQADAKADVEDKNGDAEGRVKQINEYAQAIGSLAESVISFWAKANEAERNALDRSISLQEKRVEAAQRIAERGNASYLKAEEDRLKELQVKRENAARRELAINAALQASQLLVGITGAIAKIATPGIGIAETIGAIATIFAALATGYGLVKSLQGNQPKLAEGTTYLQRGKNPPGKDTIPAWLNEGEAIIPTERNKNYKKSVEAIYHGKVPADEMNRFVENYTGNKTSTQNTVYDTTNQNLSTYKSFVTNISKVPAPVLNSFIENYQKAQYFKGTTDLKRTIEPQGRDTIPVMAHEGEAIIPTFINKLYQPTIKAVYDQKIPADRINSFVKEFHQIKPVPLVHYEKIRESAEMKIHQDGRLAGLLSEQNKMLAENNDLQRTTIRALKSMGVNVNVDRNGLALSVMEAVEQIKIDSRT